MSSLIPEPPISMLVLVLGMHRSGTSALTGALALSGLSPGKRLLAAHQDNPRGYFEHPDVVEVHDRLLAQFGLRWDDPRALPVNWLDSAPAVAAEAELVRIVDRLCHEGGIPVVKDPRTCRLVPLWRRVATRCRLSLRIVLSIRSPEEVEASLGRRDQLPRGRASLLWLTHVIESERDTRDLPRACVHYEALLADPDRVISGVSRSLSLSLRPDSKALSEFLDGGLHHHRCVDAVARDTLLASVYEQFDQEPPADAATMDRLGAQFERERGIHTRALQERWRGEHAASTKAIAGEVNDGRAENWAKLVPSLATLRASLFPSALPDPRLYTSGEEGEFREEESLVGVLDDLEGAFRVVFEIPAGRKASWLRFDPDSRPGLFVLESLTLGGISAPLGARISVAGGHPISAFGGIGLIDGDGDPHWLIDLRDWSGSVAGVSVELVFRVESLSSLLGALKLPQRLVGIGEQQQQLLENSAHHTSELRLLIQRFGEFDSKVSAVEELTSGQAEGIAKLAKELELQSGRLDGIETKLSRFDGIEAKLSKLDGMDAELARLRGIEAQLNRLDSLSLGLERLSQRSAIAHEWRRLASWLRSFIAGGSR